MGENCGSYNTVRCGQEEVPSDAVPINTEGFMAYIQERANEAEEQQAEEQQAEEQQAEEQQAEEQQEHD